MIFVFGDKTKKSKLILASVIAGLLLIGIMIGAVYTIYTSFNAKVSPIGLVPNFDDDPLQPTVEPIDTGETRAAYEPGEIIWEVALSPTEEGMLSTPAIADLNPPTGGQGKKFLEVIVACDDDHVYALDKDGEPYWTYSDCVLHYRYRRKLLRSLPLQRDQHPPASCTSAEASLVIR